MEYNGFEHLRKIFRAIGALLYPPVCIFCGTEPTLPDSDICETCANNIIPVENPVCHYCGFPIPALNSSHENLCGRCLRNRPAFDKARFSVFYTRVMRRGILEFKFHNSLFLGEALSKFLTITFYEHFAGEDLDAIIPIPVHDKRLIRRGYNQAAVLARKLGKNVGLPVLSTTLVKTVNTIPQTQLKRKQRIENVKGSFAVNNPLKIRDKKLLLLDDVFTTGSTISEASLTLKRHGANLVDALVLGLRFGPVEKDIKRNLDDFSEIFFIGGKRN